MPGYRSELEMIGLSKELASPWSELDKKYDAQFRVMFEAIRDLMAVPVPKILPYRIQDLREPRLI